VKFFLAVLLASSVGWAQSRDHRPVFKKKRVAVAGKKITVEIADDDQRRAYGLMFVTSLPKDQGMLFMFDRPDVLSFWMKNTLIPLAIGYFDAKGRLIETLEMTPESVLTKEYKTYPSGAPAKYALEMNKGWFRSNHIKKGALLKILP
jgi:uncharacterized membrane protein (UPF0127 family)